MILITGATGNIGRRVGYPLDISAARGIHVQHLAMGRHH